MSECASTQTPSGIGANWSICSDDTTGPAEPGLRRLDPDDGEIVGGNPGAAAEQRLAVGARLERHHVAAQCPPARVLAPPAGSDTGRRG